MFYIMDADTRKFIGVRSVNGKRKFFLTSTLSNATLINDKDIASFYKKLVKLAPGRTFIPDVVYEKKNVKDNKPIIIAALLYAAIVIFMVMLLFFVFTSRNSTNVIVENVDSKVTVTLPESNNNTVITVTNVETSDSIAEKALFNKSQLIKTKAIEHFDSKAIYEGALKASEKYDIPLYIIYTIIDAESDGKSYATNKSTNCIGLMQLDYNNGAVKEYNLWHRRKFTEKELYNIGNNIEVGVWYYKWCLDRIRNYYTGYYKFALKDDYEEAYFIYNIGYNSYINYDDLYHYLHEEINPTTGHSYKALKRFREKRKTCEDVFLINN